VEQVRALLPVSLAFAAGAMLALVVFELMPQAFRPATWRSALAGTVAGGAVMLALSAVLGV
jgi:zinc transporter, ZIP family